MEVDPKNKLREEEKEGSQAITSQSLDQSIQEIEDLLREIDQTSDELGVVSQEAERTHRNLGHHVLPDRQWPRQAAILLASSIATFYLVFRVFFTLNLISPFAIAFSIMLLVAEAYGLFHLALYFYQIWQLTDPLARDAIDSDIADHPTSLKNTTTPTELAPQRTIERPTGKIGPLQTYQTVDVFVTTYNEDVDLLRNTLLACVKMEYPHTTYVLDDGQREEVRKLAESLGVQYITRTDRTHAKAGNVNNALRRTNGEFVIILDADHVPHRHFLRRMIGYFEDPKVGFVQSPHTTYNLDNFLGQWDSESRIYWEDVRIFFEAVQLGKNRHGVACFCGSAAIFRREALEDVGLFATETITEDLHTGMRINAAGWKSLATNEELVVGLAPEDPDTSTKQRLRWGEGNLSVLAYDNPLTMKGLSFPGRINYFASILSWTYGPVRLILYLVPIIMLLTAVSPIANLNTIYVSIVVGYLVSVWVAVKMASNKCGNLLGIELSMMAAFHVHILAIWRAIFRRRSQRFVVTAKRRTQKVSIFRRTWPQIAIVALGFVAVSWATTRILLGLSVDYLGLGIGSLLVLYHAWLGITILQQASRRHDPIQWRHPIRLPVDYRYEANQGQAATLNLNEEGMSLLTQTELPADTPIGFTIRSAFTNAMCVGDIIQTKELNHDHGTLFLHEVAFRNPDPISRQAEIDAVNNLLFGYAVPWVIEEYRGNLSWLNPEKSYRESKGQMPFPLEIHASDSAMPDQASVVERINRHGLSAILTYPLPEGSQAEIVVHGPAEDISSRVRVASIQAVPVGVTIVYRHQFEWIKPIPAALPSTIHWLKKQHRQKGTLSRFKRKTYQNVSRNTAWATAIAILMLVTAGLFWATHRGELLLIAAAERPLTPEEIQKVESVNQSGIQSRYISTNRLLRMYHAAVAAHLPNQAAELAARLADNIPEQRCRWQITSANHWAQNSDYQKANKLLRQIIASGCDRFLPGEERAAMYIEAARVAIAVGETDRSVSLFTKSGHLRTFEHEQIDEYVGLLIAANKLPQAIRFLKQMEKVDPVLRHIVNIYEIAHQPQLAVEALETLHDRNPNDASVVRRLAELAFLREAYPAAIDYYYKLLKLRPEDPEARRELAGIFAAQGNTDKALELLRGTKDAESLMLMASILETEGRFEEALRQLRKVTKEATDTLAYQKQFTRLLLATQQYDQAVMVLVDYLERYPADPMFQQSFIDAVTASTIGDTDYHALPREMLSAVRHTLQNIYDQDKANRFGRLDLKNLQQLAYALQRLDMDRNSIDVLSLGIEKHPASRPLRFQLAQMLSDSGRYEAAETQYTILLKANPK